MPHLRFRNVPIEKLEATVPSLIDQLSRICRNDVTDYTVEWVNARYVPVVHGAAPSMDPFVEVGWFKREPPVQDQVARAIEDYLKSIGNFDYRTVVFLEYQKSSYYENGESFT